MFCGGVHTCLLCALSMHPPSWEVWGLPVTWRSWLKEKKEKRKKKQKRNGAGEKKRGRGRQSRLMFLHPYRDDASPANTRTPHSLCTSSRLAAKNLWATRARKVEDLPPTSSSFFVSRRTCQAHSSAVSPFEIVRAESPQCAHCCPAQTSSPPAPLHPGDWRASRFFGSAGHAEDRR